MICLLIEIEMLCVADIPEGFLGILRPWELFDAERDDGVMRRCTVVIK